eukprot:8421184-Prorocentrum_lima.AAC.1
MHTIFSTEEDRQACLKVCAAVVRRTKGAIDMQPPHRGNMHQIAVMMDHMARLIFWPRIRVAPSAAAA